MDALSSLSSLGLGSSLRTGGMLPPLAEAPRLRPSAELQTDAASADLGLQQPLVQRAASGRSFDNVLGELVRDVNSKQLEAGGQVRAMLSGQDVPLHRVMIATEEASVSFQLMVEVRNKLLEAYQELMRMQV
ncbi:MAG: flagellar hook-basal body complex protein FliE [Verrucomicrobiales bacterium]|nr:flagellar hook-basal body complex protein FliE [Verrucomicrobiales bacterium]